MNREKRRGLCQALRRREYGKPAKQDRNYLLSLGEDITATSFHKNKVNLLIIFLFFDFVLVSFCFDVKNSLADVVMPWSGNDLDFFPLLFQRVMIVEVSRFLIFYNTFDSLALMIQRLSMFVSYFHFCLWLCRKKDENTRQSLGLYPNIFHVLLSELMCHCQWCILIRS